MVFTPGMESSLVSIELLNIIMMTLTIVILASSIPFVIYYILDYKAQTYIITNMKLEINGGVLIKQTKSVAYSNVTNMQITKSIGGRIFKYQGITINALGNIPNLSFVGLKNAEQVYNYISTYVKFYSRANTL